MLTWTLVSRPEDLDSVFEECFERGKQVNKMVESTIFCSLESTVSAGDVFLLLGESSNCGSEIRYVMHTKCISCQHSGIMISPWGAQNISSFSTVSTATVHDAWNIGFYVNICRLRRAA